MYSQSCTNSEISDMIVKELDVKVGACRPEYDSESADFSASVSDSESPI